MKYQIQVPARINILGNPGDANEGDFATISAAINLYAHTIIEEDEKFVLESYEHLPSNSTPKESASYLSSQIPLPYNGSLDLLKAAVNRLYQFSPEFRDKIYKHGFRIATWTDVPRQSGLGGSSLFVISTLAGLKTLYGLDPDIHNDYILGELTQRTEANELGITCGYADRYVPILGGLAYIDYRGKLLQKAMMEEPFATYERLDRWADQISLVAACTGIQHTSGDVHAPMRSRYLKENDDWKRDGGATPPMIQFMMDTWETAWRGKIALLQKDMLLFGQLMNNNHQIVNEMMKYCGFTEGAGWANNLLIDTAIQAGALGAKLTGAGQGGSVFALVTPEQEALVTAEWEKAAKENNLSKAYIYRPHIVKEGLQIHVR